MKWPKALDPFLTAIAVAAIVATVLPATGPAVPVVAWSIKAAIFLLFFLYGARLHPTDALAGLTNWRLHSVMLVCTYVMFPALGLILRAVLVVMTIGLMPVLGFVIGRTVFG